MAILSEKLGVPGAVPDSLDAYYCADDLLPDLLSDGLSGSPSQKRFSDTMLGLQPGHSRDARRLRLREPRSVAVSGAFTPRGNRANGTFTSGEYVLDAAVARQIRAPRLTALNADKLGALGGTQNSTVTPMPTVLELDSGTLARGVTRFTIERAARGPSSLVGGALATGARGRILTGGGNPPA